MKPKKCLLTISGGIDSPVAGFLMLRKGFELVALHFDNRPFSNEIPLEKTKTLLEILSKKFGKKIKLCIVPHGKSQSEIVRNCNRKYTCILCRRIQFRIAEAIARKEKADFIVTGEALGQKASQTIRNIATIDSAVKIPVVRPLIGLDKEEIIKIAREAGTFETSSINTPCCSVVPMFPSTASRLEEIEFNEGKIDVGKLVREGVKGSRVVYC
jgi:thiamine biosynthesis protein ThiI